MTTNEQKELETLRKEKSIANAKRLELNAKSAEWHRVKRVKNQYYARFFEKNASDSDKKGLETVVAQATN